MIYGAFNNMLYYYLIFCVVNALEYQYRNFPIIIYLESDIINNLYL